MTRSILATAALATFLVMSEARAALVQWTAASGGNDHFYDIVLVSDGIHWDQARDAAAASGGYLATITSGEENDFVFLNLVNNPVYWNLEPGPVSNLGPWLGGFQTDSTVRPDGAWAWVTGETWSYTNWGIGEPNDNAGAVEDSLHYKCFLSSCNPVNTGIGEQWNDLPNDGSANADNTQVIAYVVEFEVSPIPVPAAFWLFGTALAGLFGFSQRKKILG